MTRSGLFPSAANAARSAFKTFEGSLVHMFVFFVVGAAVISIVEFTLTKSVSGMTTTKLLFLGFGAILAELIGLKNAILAWHRARLGGMVAWSLIWFCGFGFSLYNALGSASEFQAQRSNTQKAAATSYSDARTDLASARERVAQEEKALKELRSMTWSILPKVDGQDVSSVGAAAALIAGFEGNARFMTLSKNCTEAQGPQARKFCKDLADAKAAKASLEEKGLWQSKIGDVEKQLADARAHMASLMTQAKTTATVVDEHTPFVATMVFFGVSEVAAQFIEPLQTSFTNMVLVSLAGVVMALSRIQGEPRTPIVNWRGLQSSLFGGEAPAATPVASALVPTAQTPTNTVFVEDAEEAKRVEARLLAEMKARDAERKAREDAERAHAKEWQTRWGNALQLKSA
jgi:hypothetical protein